MGRQRSTSPSIERWLERHQAAPDKPGEILWMKAGLGLWAHRCGKATVALQIGRRCDVCGLELEVKRG